MHVDLSLPRDAWEAHPNFPSQVLLLGSHRQFRRISRQLIEQADTGRRREAILAVFGYWKSAMRGHEHYEEGKLYPYLQHRWGLDCTPLEQGHRALAEADAAVRAADDATLVHALEDHHAILMRHLDAEEALVIPALLALSREDFETYYDSPIRYLLRHTACHAEAGCPACRAVRPSVS